jgi:hypothetical protein
MPDTGRDGFSIRAILRNGRIADFEVIPHSRFQGALNPIEGGDEPCARRVTPLSACLHAEPIATARKDNPHAR